MIGLDEDDDGDDSSDEDFDSSQEAEDDADHSEDSAQMVPCPFCHKPVFEEADVCPSCGNYISHDAMVTRKPWWVILGVIVMLIIFLIMALSEK